MDAYLSELGYDFLKRRVDLPEHLEDLIQRDFLIENDCLILKDENENSSNPIFEQDLEKCEWEDHHNHFHPDFAYVDTKDELDYLKAALECGKRLAHRFSQELPHHRIRLLISFSETTEENGETEVYGSSTVRFYQIRPACEERMRLEDLETFESEAILEIET
jgi:hypothetical protein